MERKIEVDIGRLLAVVGPRLYRSPRVVMDELVQNAQRSGVEHLQVRYLRTYAPGMEVVELEDDGCGLTDPADLLRLASSGWSEETTEREEPFGMGFWSTVAVADLVVVRSRTWEVSINAARLRATRSVEGVIETRSVEEDLAGFRVTLHSPKARTLWTSQRGEAAPEEMTAADQMMVEAWDSFAGWGLEDHVKSLVTYLPIAKVSWVDWSVYGDQGADLDGSLAGARESEGTTFQSGRDPLWVPSDLDERTVLRVTTPLFTGVLWAGRSSWEGQPKAPWTGLRLMYQRREVARQEKSAHGVLFLTRDAATPRAPDRKDFVRDRRWTDLQAAMQEQVVRLYRKVLAEAPERLGTFDSSIVRVLSEEDLMTLLPVDVMGKEDLPEPKPKEQAVVESVEVNEPSVGTPTAGALEAARLRQRLAREEPPPIRRAVETIDDDTPECSRRPRQRLVELDQQVVWAEPAELEKYDVVLRELLSMTGLSVVVARTKASLKALKALSEKEPDRVRHVGRFVEAVRVEVALVAPPTPSPMLEAVGLQMEKTLHRLPCMLALGRAVVSVGTLTEWRVTTVCERQVRIPGSTRSAEATVLDDADCGLVVYVSELAVMEACDRVPEAAAPLLLLPKVAPAVVAHLHRIDADCEVTVADVLTEMLVALAADMGGEHVLA